MQRVIDALTAEPGPVANYLTPSEQSDIRAAGESITYTLQIHNLNPNGSPDTYSLTGEGNNWPSSLLSSTVTVAACDVSTVSVRVEIPQGTVWDASDVYTVHARSAISPAIQSSAVISTNTPAPILLVDDDRWYDMEAYYETALAQNGLPYDYWRVGWRLGDTAQGSPTVQTLEMYPIIVWFTGYDWAVPLTAVDEQRLGESMSSGSSLLLSSQDYLSVREINPFGRYFFGLDTYEEITTTQVVGVKENALTDLLPGYPLDCQHGNRSHIVIPTATSDAAFEGDHERAVGLTHAGGQFRTAFLPFLFEGITPETGRRDTMRQLTGWLSWLGGSTFDSGTTTTAGSTVTYTLTMSNSGWQPVSAHAQNAMPANLDYVPDSLSPPEAVFDGPTNSIRWDRELAPGEQSQLTYRAVISSAISTATPITNVVRIGYTEHHIEFDLARITDVDAPDLSASTLSVDRAEIEPGGTLTYAIILRNDGLSAAASTVLTNPIPSYTTYVTGSLQQQGTHSATDYGGIIAWDSSLGVGESLTLTYQATVGITRPVSRFTTSRTCGTTTIPDAVWRPTPLYRPVTSGSRWFSRITGDDRHVMKRTWDIAATLGLGVLVAVLFQGTFVWLFRQWFSNDYYAHGVLIPLVSAFLIWRRWKAPHPTANSTMAGGLLLGVGISGHIWAMAERATYQSALCLIVVLGGLILLLYGAGELWQATFPLLFLIAAIPLPFIERISLPLQLVTAHWVSEVASLVGLQVTRNGAQLSLQGCALVVGAPCSGLRSLVAFTSIIALLAYVTYGHRVSKLILIVVALPVALGVNVLRITSLLIIAQLAGEEVAMRYYHTAFGIVFYVLALGILIILARCLGCHELRSDI